MLHRIGSEFTSKWEGPYIIHEVHSNGAYKMFNKLGVQVQPINEKFPKCYFP